MFNLDDLSALPGSKNLNIWDFSREINALEKLNDEKGKETMSEEKEILSRRDRFKKYRDKRLYQAVRAIKLCENMANKNSYDYSEEEAKIIIKNIQDALSNLRHAFSKGEKKTKFF